MLIFLLVPMAASASDTMERISRDREINIGYATVSVIALSFSMFLVVIVYLDRPYLGKKGVSSEPYQIVLENFVL